MASKSKKEFSEGRKPLRELEFEIRSEVYDGLISPEEAHRRLCLLAAKIRRPARREIPAPPDARKSLAMAGRTVTFGATASGIFDRLRRPVRHTVHFRDGRCVPPHACR